MRSKCIILLSSVLMMFSVVETLFPLWLQELHSSIKANIWSTITNIPHLIIGLRKFDMENREFRQQQFPDTTPESDSEYDFIVVGAGSAGSALSARLSEIENAQILVLEAGGLEDLSMDVPLVLPLNLIRPDVNWMYFAEPSDKYCVGTIGGRCVWPFGRVMGGTSVINGMTATRGQARVYDLWAETGNTGWSYEDVLPYFKKLETIASPDLANDTEFHNTNGPVYIGRLPYRTQLATSFVKAGVELGYPEPSDAVGKSLMGFTYAHVTIKNGVRFSGNRAYLVPISARKNLHMSRNSLARKILFDRSANRAVGVEFIKNGKIIQVFAKKEVILCAGVIGSAQILMLSGIGPENDLNRLGISVLRSAPVGRNLMDSMATPLNFIIDESITTRYQDVLRLSNPYVTEYLLKREGPFTLPGGLEAHGYINVDNPNDISGIPNIELIFFSTNVCGLFLPCLESIHENVWSILAYMNNPQSRGYVRLSSKDINVKPEIVPNYLDHPEDVRALIKGIRIAINISETQEMRKYKPRLFRPHLPRCDRLEDQSDEYWECVGRTMTIMGSHYAGTCRMGPENDPTAVVNPRLQVIGVKGLRVADASIIPHFPAAHPTLAVYMIGEKLADMIKQDWNYPIS